MTAIQACRGCGSDWLTDVLDLGVQHLSDFRDDRQKPPAHPLILTVCRSCTLAQLRNTAPREQMYTDRYGYYSGVNEAIRQDLASVVATAIQHQPEPSTWLDIASNDGTLLSFVPASVYRVGCDPVDKFRSVAARHANRIIADYFDPAYFAEQFDVITSVSMFYDLDDPGAFVAGVAKVLAADGVWVIQQNYLIAMLAATSYDNVSHEHLTYFSLTSLEPLLERHGLEVVDVTTSPVNGGCFRTVVAHGGSRRPALNVAEMRASERAARLHETAPYELFATSVAESVAELRAYVADAKADGKTVMVYAASTRGAVIWQACGFGPDLIDAAVERNDDKVGLRYSPIDVPIISEAQARLERPDVMLVGPWWHRDLFVAREAAYLAGGGTLVFPLPAMEIVTA